MMRSRLVKGMMCYGFSFVIAWVVVQFLHQSVSDHGRVEPSYKIRESDLDAFETKFLADSIVAIIQNYYVDKNRTSPQYLLSSTLKDMAKKTNLTLKADQESLHLVSPENNASLRFSTGEKYLKEDLVRDLVDLGKFYSLYRQDINGPTDYREVVNFLLSSLDPHSALLDEYAYKELRQGTEGSFGGLGVVVGIKDSLLTVIKPIPGSPAAKAGIRKGDKILSINSVNTYGATLDSLVEHMRGKVGTVVDLNLIRKGDYSPSYLSLKREIIQVDSVLSTHIPVQNGFVLRAAIESFTAKTTTELKLAIKKAMISPENLIGIVLDLRSNPGGLLDQAVQVSDIFLRKGKIVSTRGRRHEVERAGVGYFEFDMPVVVLISPESASASEIVAGALKDNNRAVVIGQPSFGKGSVQTIFELPGAQALKLTIARYYTPSGVSIQNMGIVPDIWLQPIQRKRTNINLMGSSRFRNERSLEHSLDLSPLGGVNRPPVRYKIKSFYLVDEINLSPLDSVVTGDFELRYGAQVIGLLAKYNIADSVGNLFSMHNIKAGEGSVIHSLAQKNAEALAFIEEQFGVKWSTERQAPVISKLSIDLNANESLSGTNTYKVKWVLDNFGEIDLDRASLYIQYDDAFKDTFEFLIGSVKKGSKGQGEVMLPLPDYHAKKDISFKAWLAIDGRPSGLAGEEFSFPIRSKSLLNFSVDANIVNEVGGIVDSSLEPNEHVDIRVTVTNKSKHFAKNVEVGLVNLSGDQIRVGSPNSKIEEIGPGESRFLLIPVAVENQLMSSALDFGINVGAENLSPTLKSHVNFSGIPNANLPASRDNLLQAH